VDCEGFFFSSSTWLLPTRNSGALKKKKNEGGIIIWQKNERNSHNQALKRANDTVMAKLKSERVKNPRPT
jgi:hypothetical protein